MRRKYEDDLIKLAFGDSEPEGCDRAKRLLEGDAEAAKLYASYSDLRAGLRQLKAPEHQLSTERLRNRILADGLKPKPALHWGWRWSLAPVAVAAAALLVTLRLSGSEPIPMPGYVADPSLSPSAFASESPISFNPAKRLDAVITSAAEGGIGTDERESAPAPIAASTPRAGAAPGRNSGGPPSVRLAAGAITPEEMSNLALDGSLPAGAVALVQDPSGEEPIVLIGAESDDATGAKRATEVSSASNVVVGG